ncbi:hypothetical protein CSAL01_12682 [Colletotrichum salicis]|uniref:Uncharacterized protein n=1 Tax=Colletotrichum salicis TaxID=1209931 RepID=A0A135UUY6_9PEZI|nr:hypothetical protein CSAL01_12682 [Colletotrichum salicis]
MDWSEEQMSSFDAEWLTNAADRLGISFPNEWNKCRLECGPQEDHVAEYIAQLLLLLLLRYLPQSAQPQSHSHPSMEVHPPQELDTNQRNRTHSFSCGGSKTSPSISALSRPGARQATESYSTALPTSPRSTSTIRAPFESHRVSASSTLRSLTFTTCSTDRSSIKNTLQATPKIISFEYHARPSTAQNTRKTRTRDGLLTPRMLCQLLSNNLDRTEPPLRNGRGERVSAVLPEFHRQLRMLVIDFPVGEDESIWWKREATITNMRGFRLLKHLSIDAGSITCRSQGGGITVNDLDELIPEKLESLVITRVGECFDHLMQTSLPELARELRNGRSSSLQ